jgi:hypothetical protein
MGWEKFKKYRTWKMRRLDEKGKDLYELKAEPLIPPFALLRGETGVRDRCPSGTDQLPHYPNWRI